MDCIDKLIGNAGYGVKFICSQFMPEEDTQPSAIYCMDAIVAYEIFNNFCNKYRMRSYADVAKDMSLYEINNLRAIFGILPPPLVQGKKVSLIMHKLEMAAKEKARINNPVQTKSA